MELRTEKSIWDKLPEEWKSEKEHSLNITDNSETKEAAFTDSIPSPVSPMIKDAPADNSFCLNTEPMNEIANTVSRKGHKNKRKQRKIEKEKYAEFEKRSRENRVNSSEHAKRAYQKEEKENKHDFMILGITFSVIILGIIIFVLAFTKTPTQHIYDLINQGNYSIAYQEITKLYEKGKNVDALVYTFAEDCVRNSEYKRAVASLEYLSSDAETNKEFFDALIDIMLSHGKTNRALEVIECMQSHGDVLSQYAVELRDKYSDRF